jgi:hypothetical protein
MTLDFQIDETPIGYDVTGLIRTNGLLGLLYNFNLRTESHGAVTADTLHPTAHESDSHWSNKERRAHLDYLGEGKVTTALNPPEDPDRPGPSAEQITGTVDPLTAILTMSHAIARAGRCSASIPVFDGRRRYDLVLVDDGTERIEPSRAYAYSGDARRCIVDMIKIAGFSRDRDYAPHTNHGRVWIAAPRPDAPPLPVRIDFLSDWGPITVRMVKADPPKRQ